jgi:hypothetical protein
MGMNSDRPPFRLVSAAFLLTFVIFGMFGYFSWNSHKDIKESMQQSLRIVELKGTILLYDEVLTMSAKMAPVSGDILYESVKC